MLGIDDVGLHRDRLDLALADCKEDGFRILVSHNPDIIKMSGNEQISLVLSTIRMEDKSDYSHLKIFKRWRI